MGALLPACFVISGATSLILQVVWVRKLVEIFGSSTLAIATVLASFMGGLALGAALGGRLADHFGARGGRGKDDPFLYYGLAEVIVGLSALVIPVLIAGFRGPNAWLWLHLGETPSLLAMARFGLTALALLIPTTAMGATLPLLTRRVTARAGGLSNLGRSLGVLYAANTFGAVIGAALAGFVLIPSMGAHASGQLAALIAIALAAAVAVAVAVGRRRPSLDPDPDSMATETPPKDGDRQRRTIALIAYALSGAVAMGLEVLFSRAMAIINGSSVTSFTLVLVVFLGGISLGAALIARHADRSRNPIGLLGGLLLAAAAAIAFATFVIDDLPAVSAILLEGGRLHASSILAVHASITALTIAPVAMCLGAIMPVAIRAYVGSGDRVGRDVGKAYAANTVGAIVGSVATGFVLMPALSIEGTLRLLVALDALMGMALLWISINRKASGARRRQTVVVGLTAAVLASAVAAPSWNQSDFTAGLFRTHIARAAIRLGYLSQRDVLFYKDGTATTVTVEKLRSGVVLLKNNGKAEASSRTDMPTQILVGLLPGLLHPGENKDAFVVGYGSGVSVGAVLAAPGIKRVDVAELEPAVLEAADAFFSDINGAPQNDPRVRRLIGDGRNVLLAGGRQYDLIVSEPSNPWIAGVASLFSREFYAFARRHLREGGIFCQWAQLYELGPASVKMIYRTFAEAFPYVYAFTPGDEVTDTILIGSLTPIDLTPARLTAVLATHPNAARELKRAEIRSAADLIASVFLLPTDIASFTAGAGINTDDNGALEYQAPRDLLNSAERVSVARLVRSPGWPYGELAELLPPGDDDVALAAALLRYGRRRAGSQFLERAPPSMRRDEIELLYALSRAREFADPELSITTGGPSIPALEESLFAKPGESAAKGVKALRNSFPLIARGEWRAAYKKIARLPKRAQTDAGNDVSLLLGYVAYKSVELKRAEDVLARLADRVGATERRPAILYYLGRSRYGIGSFRLGADTLIELAERFPEVAKDAIVDPFEKLNRGAEDGGTSDDRLPP